jgi:TRAP transporter TAXI family solute receptor
MENRKMLVTGKAHLGLLQASAVDIEQVAVIAPLYREFGHVIVRKNSPIRSIEDLNGLTIAVGPDGSGNRASALKILAFFDVTEQNAKFSKDDFVQLETERNLDAAIVVTGLENPKLWSLFETGDFRLLPIPSREEIFLATGFDPATLKSADYPMALNPEEEISTVTTAALLVVHEGERDAIVEAACECLLADGLLESLPGRLSPENFLYLTKSLPMHPAAVRFFTSRRPANAPVSE